MFRRRLQKIGSILGLLAILMTSIAPTVSHALASHDRLGQALSTYCSAEPGFNESGNSTPSSHSGALHWQACAYCGLLAHFPILTGTTVAFAAAVSVTSTRLPVVRTAIRALPLFTAAQPRAPPAIP
jgi:hypothetical protein